MTRRPRNGVVVQVVQRDVPLAVAHERLLEVRAACHRDGAICQSSQSVVLGGRGRGELHFGRHRLCMCVMDVYNTLKSGIVVINKSPALKASFFSFFLFFFFFFSFFFFKTDTIKIYYYCS